MFWFFSYILGGIAIKYLGFEEFMDLSWLSLLTSTSLLVYYNIKEQKNKSILFALGIICVLGILVEIIGVVTGWPFGQYEYGGALGWSIMDVPIVIGLNWFLVIFGANAVAHLITGSSMIVRVILTALIAVFLDYLIEPVAIAYDMWFWELAGIPWSNYLAWGVIALIFAFVIEFFMKDSRRSLGIELYLFLTIFFFILA
jgi:putative membrane protein